MTDVMTEVGSPRGRAVDRPSPGPYPQPPTWTGAFDIDLEAAVGWLAEEAAGPETGPHEAGVRMRREFLTRHADALHARLTDDGAAELRLDELSEAAARLMPGLVPSGFELAAERGLGQSTKSGREVWQGVFFWALLRAPQAGPRVVHAMTLPTRRAQQLLPELLATDRVDLGQALVERDGRVGRVTLRNPRFLNAEDDAVVEALETAVDLVLLDDRIGVGVLRGGTIDHPRYQGRRIFNAGINLTGLYEGLISFTGFMLRRELGYLNKLYRGLGVPGDPGADGQEKPWIGVVDTFAIGGGAQILLALDYVLAERDAYFSLPALREGIIPGAANLRLHRHAGPRAARQMIFADRQVAATEPIAALLCDEALPAAGLDEALARVAAMLDTPAVVPNRRVLRQAEEPVEVFRTYLAQYSLEQVRRMYSPDLVANLERGWINRRR